ncbi:phosphotransferase [Actinomadura algeriensis]|uniref:Aminoglycoside phosphotransferase (APT) family kinase protein n=1 Tax=Actinomadura algeriensis TaxID=1679523 RepID=A0ABR9JZE2_9ACTN|nr:phosphotransferase [Actinomadura algeriensis]MBE1535944.1 aminoglycoside phosphotransferase (APT) family kinase protein [Actinomadura algeriensis]
MEWAAEHEITADAAAELVGERFPELRGAPVEPLATGWDNTVFRVGGEWAFRFPRRKIAIPGVEREIATLAALAPRLPLPIPVPRYVGEPGGGFPWPFWGARLVPGRELAEVRPSDGRRAAIGAALGAFLRALHDPALVRAAGAGLPADPLRRGDPAYRAPKAAERLERLAALGLWEPDPSVRAFLGDALDEASPPAGEPVIVHGDLHVRHVLLGAGDEAAGVIDWGDVCLADPSVDLSLAYAAFAGDDRAAFLDAYGPVPPDRERAARVLALFIAATLAEYAASDGSAALLAESLAGIGRVLAP